MQLLKVLLLAMATLTMAKPIDYNRRMGSPSCITKWTCFLLSIAIPQRLVREANEVSSTNGWRVKREEDDDEDVPFAVNFAAQSDKVKRAEEDEDDDEVPFAMNFPA